MHLADELPTVPTTGGYTQQQYKMARENIMNQKIACRTLTRADRGRYGKLIEEVENTYLKGNNHYPHTPTKAYNLLVNYKNYSANKRTAVRGRLEQVAFVTDGKKLKTGKEFSHIECFKCGEMGHYKSDCQEKKNKNQGEDESQEVCQVIQATMLMVQARVMNGKQGTNSMWILCDNLSTIDIIKNKNMITNIRNTNNPVEIMGIGGTTIRINQVGDLLGYGTVYYHPDVSANIILFYHLVRRFKSVTYDSKINDAFIVTRDDDSTMEFIPSPEGLYHYDFNISIKWRQELAKLKESREIL
jgi:hypothetical protein